MEYNFSVLKRSAQKKEKKKRRKGGLFNRDVFDFGLGFFFFFLRINGRNLFKE